MKSFRFLQSVKWLAFGMYASGTFVSSASSAGGLCTFLSGEARRLCLLAEARTRSTSNRTVTDSRWENKAKNPSEDTASRNQPNSSNTPSNYWRRADGSEVGSPNYNLNATPPTMSFWYRPSYSRTGKQVTVTITRTCYGTTGKYVGLTFEQACTVDTLQGGLAALPLFRRGCEEGDPSACYMVGTRSPSKSDERIKFFRLACANGQDMACYEMAEAYRVGNGVPKNVDETRKFYQQACASGNAYSCRWLDGKIDPACPHGVRVYNINLDRNTYKVTCETPREGLLSPISVEIPATSAEIAMMKREAPLMRNAKTIPIGDFIRSAMSASDGTTSSNSPSNNNCRLVPVDVNGAGGIVYGRQC